MARKKSKTKYVGEVTIAKGKEWEREVNIPYPKGKKWRKMSPKLMQFVLMFSENSRKLSEPEPEFVEAGDIITPDGKISPEEEAKKNLEMVKAIGSLWDEDEFENDYLPAVFGLDTPDGRKYLENEGTMMDMVEPFLTAASMIMAAAMGGEDVQTALKNSQADEEA